MFIEISTIYLREIIKGTVTFRKCLKCNDGHKTTNNEQLVCENCEGVGYVNTNHINK